MNAQTIKRATVTHGELRKRIEVKMQRAIGVTISPVQVQLTRSLAVEVVNGALAYETALRLAMDCED